MAQATNTELKEIALKSQISRQVGLKKNQEQMKNHAEEFLVRSWKMLYQTCGYELEEGESVHDLIWEFIEKEEWRRWKENVSSEKVGVLTTLKDYTNKKGVVSIAHYTQNDKYLGGTKQYGIQPTYYTGNFPITKKYFKLDEREMRNLKGENRIEKIFMGIKE